MQILNLESVILRNARVIDPISRRDEVTNVALDHGIIVDDDPKDAETVDATGLIVCPGFLDIHVHLREPGQSQKETIETGSRAAAAGGFTFVACMPNTQPVLDSVEQVEWVLQEARKVDYCEVGPIAAITENRSGRNVADLRELSRNGAVAFSDDGTGVEDDRVMRQAFELARELGVVLIQHCEYKAISAGGVMHLGAVSEKLGLPGLDPRSEEAMIERDIDLCRASSGRYHVAHVSTAKAVELVRAAKAEGLPVTAEVCPHHLLLTHEACAERDPLTKMHPPLREKEDADACLAGLIDGTIDCIATDHAPHTSEEKAVGFLKAPPGLVGLETALGLSARAMVDSGQADWSRLISWFTTGPALVLGRACTGIRPGAKANLTVVDPDCTWNVDASKFHSKSSNTPFQGWELGARSLGTIRGTRIVDSFGVLSERIR